MDENRFERLFENHNICAFDDAPVWLLAHALLHDNYKATLIAQVKLKNLSNQLISEVVLDVKCWDHENVPLPNVTGFSMRNLAIARDEVFGQKIPIVLPDNRTCTISPILNRVVFNDGSVWIASENNSSKIVPEQVYLIDAWRNDAELVRQFHIETATKGEFLPDIIGHFWRCSCGEINTQAEVVCYACGADKKHQFSVITQPEWLADRSALRVEEEHILNRRKRDKWRLRLIPRHNHAKPKGNLSVLLLISGWVKRHLKWVIAITTTLLVILALLLLFDSNKAQKHSDPTRANAARVVSAISPTPSATPSPTVIPSPTQTPKLTPEPTPTPAPTEALRGYFDLSFTEYIEQFNERGKTFNMKIVKSSSGFNLYYKGEDSGYLVFNTDVNDPTMYAYSSVELKQFNELTLRCVVDNVDTIDFDFLNNFSAIGCLFAQVFNPDIGVVPFSENATIDAYDLDYVRMHWDVEGIRYEVTASIYRSLDPYIMAFYDFNCSIL